MDRHSFWQSEPQFVRLAPHLPTDTRGKPRVGDRRFISGIVLMSKPGGRWVNTPTVNHLGEALDNRDVPEGRHGGVA